MGLFFRVTVEPGMRISSLSRILETVSLSLDVYGRVPDLTVCDAIAVGELIILFLVTNRSNTLFGFFRVVVYQQSVVWWPPF